MVANMEKPKKNTPQQKNHGKASSKLSAIKSKKKSEYCIILTTEDRLLGEWFEHPEQRKAGLSYLSNSFPTIKSYHEDIYSALRDKAMTDPKRMLLRGKYQNIGCLKRKLYFEALNFKRSLAAKNKVFVGVSLCEINEFLPESDVNSHIAHIRRLEALELIVIFSHHLESLLDSRERLVWKVMRRTLSIKAVQLYDEMTAEEQSLFQSPEGNATGKRLRKNALTTLGKTLHRLEELFPVVLEKVEGRN